MFKSIRSLFLLIALVGSLFIYQVQTVYAISIPAEINKQFTPILINAGDISVLRVTIFNPNTFPLTNASWTDYLIGVQPGLKIATPNGLNNTCGGSIVALPNTTTLSLNGGAVPAQVGATPGECYVEINVTSTTTGNLINTIPANNLNANGNDNGNPVTISNTTPASATITVLAVAAPTLSKGFNPNTIFVGEISQLTITINNNDPSTDLTQTSYTDTLPANVVLANPVSPVVNNCGAYSLTALANTNSIAISNATVTPSQNCTVTVNVTSSVSGQYTNTIPAGPGGLGSIVTQQGVTNTNPASANLNVQPVGVTKNFTPATITAGGTSILTITLQNPTGSNYTGVGITDNLPAGLTISGTPTSPQCGGTVISTATSITLIGGVIPASVTPPTTVGTCTITATVLAGLTTSGTLSNTIPANSLTVAQPGVTNILPAQGNLVVNPSLTGTKAYSPTSIVINGVSTVTITLNNNSSTNLTGINFTDTFPANLSISGTPATSQCNGVITNTANSITLAGGSIPAGTFCTIVFNVTSSVAGGGTTYENTIPAGAINSNQGVVNTSAISTSTDLTVVNAVNLPVTINKSFTIPTILPGQISRLYIDITAPIDTPISGINISDTLPAGLVIANPPAPSQSCPGGTLTAVNGTSVIQFTNTNADLLAAGATCSIHVSVTSTTPGTYNNIIPVNNVSTSQGRTNNTDSNTATVVVTNMSMSKAFYPPVVQANGLSTLTITLENTNSSPLINVQLTDTLPGSFTDGVLIAPVPNASTTCTDGSVIPTIVAVSGSQIITMTGGIVPAQSGAIPGICTITVTVQGKDSNATPSNRTNTIPSANVSGTVQNTGTVIHPLGQAQAVLRTEPLIIGVVKGFNPVLVYGGAYSTMSVQLVNPNNADLTGITFTDDMTLLGTGMKLADPVAFDVGTCGGILTGNPGDTSFTFTGGTLLANTNCVITLRVVMAVNGNLTNRIPAGAVTTFNGVSSTQPTEASLTNLPGASVSKSFNPNTILTGGYSTLTITIQNTSNIPLVGMALIDSLPGALPTGLEIAGSSAPAPTNNCGFTSFSAPPGSQTIALTGGSLAGDASCTITVSVTSSVPGTYVNIIPAGGLTATAGGSPISNNNPASATLVVNAGALSYSLGNRVWFDTNNSGTIDGTEVGINGVRVDLYVADVNGNPTGAVLSTQTTTNGGYYRFDNLPAGNYVVLIPASEFGTGGVLDGYWSSGTTLSGAGTSETTAPASNTDIDSDDNGTLQTGAGTFNGAVISSAVMLGPGASEPTGETDKSGVPGDAPDAQSNLTVDFGFYRQQLGNLIFVDANKSGMYDAGDTLLPGATVQLFASNGTTEINVGPDGILGTADDAPGGVITGASGTYLFNGLPTGDYIVKVTPPVGYSSTVDTASGADTNNPNTNIDNNDNGVGTSSGQAVSNLVSLTPGSVGAATNNTVSNSTGTTTNLTMDFGFVPSNGISKIIIATDQAFTTGNDVAIGEMITYQVTVNLPVGAALNNVTIIDRMDKGLAFVDCLSANVSGVDLTSTVCATAAVSSVTDAGDSPANPANPGRQVVFNIGNIAASAEVSSIVIQYRAIALDTIENQQSHTLNNDVAWTWTGGSQSAIAPDVTVVEPDLKIEKKADVNFIANGSPAVFTLVISHTSASNADAFDVVVKDVLPVGLDYVANSINCDSGEQDPDVGSCIYDAGTRTIKAQWSSFTRLPVGGRGIIRFSVIGNASIPTNGSVTNVGSVEWTSILGNHASPISSFNPLSTERYYDPTNPVNLYSASASLVLTPLGGAGGGVGGKGNKSSSTTFVGGFLIPVTGFAPNIVTKLDTASSLTNSPTNLTIEIPVLKVNASIVGVEFQNGDWDLSWLQNQAGWLNGTAYPTWTGNSVLTGHVVNADGKPGVFSKLKYLASGEYIFVYNRGYRYTYQVVSNQFVQPNDITVLNHEDKAYLTLITCDTYDVKTGTYLRRVAVRAVLVDVTETK